MVSDVNISFDQMTVCDGVGWFVDINFNVLFKMDLETEKIEMVCELPIYNHHRYQYRRMIAVKKLLIIIPYNADKILIYDVTQNKIKEVALDSSYSANGMLLNFADAFVCGEYVYFIPARYRAIVKMHSKHHSLEYFEDCIREIVMEKPFNNNRHIFSGTYVLEDKIAYLPLWQRGAYLKVNIENMSFDIINVDKDIIGFQGMCKQEGNYVFSEKDKMSFWITDKNGVVLKQYFINENKSGISSGVSRFIENDNGYWMIPAKGENICIIDKEFKMLQTIYNKKLEYLNNSKKYAYGDLSFGECCLYGGNVFIYSWYDGVCLKIDLSTQKIHKISMKYKMNDLLKQQLQAFGKHYCNVIVREDVFFDLSTFINSI